IFVVDMLSRDHVRRMMQHFEFGPDVFPIGEYKNRPQYSQNTLFLNQGGGHYAEIANLSGLAATEWSWTPIFLDVDLDGYEDLLISNGFERDNMNADILQRLEVAKREQKLNSIDQLRLRKMFPRLSTPNLAFRNLGNLRFADSSAEWGFNASGVSQGMALADLDNDGDMDVIINNLNGPGSIYRNEGSAPRVGVRLKGLPGNTRGIGAKISIKGGPVAQSQEMQCGGRYLSSDHPQRTFAAGVGKMTLEVTWRSGRKTICNDVAANRIYEVDEVDAQEIIEPVTAQKPSLFQDVSDTLNHRHHEDAFDDFAAQPLLRYRLSRSGPGITWFDLDGDGWEDLIISTGKGGAPGLYRNDHKGSFALFEKPGLLQPVTRDQSAIIGFPAANGGSLLAGSSNYKDGFAEGAAVRRLDLNPPNVADAVPGEASSTGPLLLGDIDGDGVLELFVGGRVLPGHFPMPASSRLFRQEGGHWKLDLENTKSFQNLGLVNGAMFTDLNGDGFPELVCACAWGPIKIFQNEHGKFKETTDALGFGKWLGLWNGVAVGDFDEDGRLDIVASNWGRNTSYEIYAKDSLRLYYGDFDADGITDILEAGWDEHLKKVVPTQSFTRVGGALPFVRERMGTFANYAHASVQDILGDRLANAKELRANLLETTLFLNRGDHFDAVPLPLEAQFAPAFGICVADFDGDGHEDIFLAQNFFATHLEAPRLDAGRGLLLLGNGHGGFRVVSAEESGIKIYGEHRGAAAADFDQDGRVDLAVGQNGAETKLYHNVAAQSGVRIRLAGPPGNPHAYGSAMRLSSKSNQGALREVHGGSGYWSQDGSVQVWAVSKESAKIWVRWPGGKTNAFDVPAGVKQVTLNFDGQLQAK
ncbi:MAG TPA: VCBS repeat-containing protein, partial [Verrucomicrobiae bacterium]